MSGSGTLDGEPVWRKLSIHGGPITTYVITQILRGFKFENILKYGQEVGSKMS